MPNDKPSDNLPPSLKKKNVHSVLLLHDRTQVPDPTGTIQELLFFPKFKCF